MGKPLMLQEEDDERIEALRKQLGIHTKVGVVRTAIDLLEQDARRREASQRWRRAAGLAAATSRAVNSEFRGYSRLKRS
jgi:hypothetical protein